MKYLKKIKNSDGQKEFFTIQSPSRYNKFLIPYTKLKNKFYIKYYMIKAGNNNPKLVQQQNQLLHQLEKLLL